MALSNISGFPRIGPQRELKFATEGHWKGAVSADELMAVGRKIRLDNWRFMQEAGVDLIPSNDFSLYDQELDALRLAYEELAKVQERTRILVKTYFDHVGDAYGVLRDLPVEGVGLDFHRGRHNVELIANQGGLTDQTLFAGIVDGRNVWIADLEHSLDLLEGLRDRAGEIVVSTSCSLLHTPIDLDGETDLDDELRSWMAFARQKVGETVTLARGLEGREQIAGELDANDRALEDRRNSHRTRNP